MPKHGREKVTWLAGPLRGHLFSPERLSEDRCLRGGFDGNDPHGRERPRVVYAFGGADSVVVLSGETTLAGRGPSLELSRSEKTRHGETHSDSASPMKLTKSDIGTTGPWMGTMVSMSSFRRFMFW